MSFEVNQQQVDLLSVLSLRKLLVIQAYHQYTQYRVGGEINIENGCEYGCHLLSFGKLKP